MKDFAYKKNLTLITTEKDYLRLNKNDRTDIKYLKINLKLKNIKKLKKILSGKLWRT